MFILKIDLKSGITFESIDEALRAEYPESYWWSLPVFKTRSVFSNFVFERIDYAIDAKRKVAGNEMVNGVELFFVVSQFKRARLPERTLRRIITR